MQRINLTRYRRGSSSSLSVAMAWLWVTAVRASSNLIAPVVSWVRLNQSLDILVGDIFKLTDGRLFIVQQIVPEGITNKCACSEVAKVVPDDFAAQILNPWWTAAGVGSWEIVEGEASVMLTAPVTTLPSTGAQLTQSVIGDFDVAARINAAAGETTNPQYAYLGGQMGTSGVWIGACGMESPMVLRVDEEAGAVQMTIIAVAANYFRLVRQGADWLTYYCDLVQGPKTKADWKLLRPTVEVALGMGAASVGLGGMCGDAGEVSTIYWVKNEWPQ